MEPQKGRLISSLLFLNVEVNLHYNKRPIAVPAPVPLIHLFISYITLFEYDPELTETEITLQTIIK